MIRFLLSLLLLEVCVGTAVDYEHSSRWTSFERSLSSNKVQSRRVARDVAEKKTFAEPGNYVTTVIYCDVPPLPDTISVGSASDKTDKFSILFNQVTFSKLSSAFALLYRIDLDAQIVQLILRLGKAHINGSYCLSTSSLPNSAYDDFEVNLFADLMYSQNIRFYIDDEHEQSISFGKVEDRRLHYKKVKGRYVNVPGALAEEVKSYLSPVLLEAIVDKIQEELSTKLRLDNVSHQIESEMAFKSRNSLADRLKRAVANAFAYVRWNAFNVLHYDTTNFYRIIQNFDVTIPSFVLRDIDKFVAEDMKFSFVGDNVHAKGVFRTPSSLAIVKVEYCNRNNPLRKNNTVEGEYHISDIFWEFEVIARPKTKTVEVANIGSQLSSVTLAPSQGFYGDERDLIIRHLIPYMKVYIPNNSYHPFAKYIQGIVAEGRIAHEVFE